jgi:glycosyltransferase involved in cell wall biosynthesis
MRVYSAQGNPMLNINPSILHAIDTTGPGGAETVFLDLAQYLTVDGYNNIAIIKGPGWVEEQLKQRGVRYYILRPRSGFSISYYAALYKLIKTHRVKLIQAHLLGSTLTYSLIALLMRLPLVATLHGRVDVNPNEKFIAIKNKIMQFGVNKLVAVSQDLAAYIAARGLFKKADIAIIYNGIDIKKYQKTNAQAIRQSLAIDPQALLIGSVGNVRPAKAYKVLIDAAKIVTERQPSVHFIIAGHKKADLMAELDAQLQRLHLADKVHFIGFQQDSAAFLGQMDLFALSSSSEGFSIATLEAMATELPVVATRCGGPEEILQHESTGLLVALNNPNELAAALLQLMQDPQLQQRLAQQGKQHVANTFAMDTLLAQYRTIYAGLINRQAT